jgi:membrane protein
MKRLRVIRDAVTFIFRDIERKHLHVVAAGVAYFFVIAFFPVLLLLAAVLSYLPLQNATHGVSAFMSHVMPRQSLSFLEGALATVAPHRTGMLSLGLISTLWIASIGMKGIISGLDIVYNVRVPRRLWTNRFLAFGLALGVGFLFFTGVLLTLAGPVLERALEAIVPLQSLWITLWPYLQWSVSALFTFAAIALLYLLAPNIPPSQRVTLPGAIISAVSWLALSWGLSFYFQHFGSMKLDKLYGALATPVILMIWLNWGAFVILLGAEINLTIDAHKERRMLVHPVRKTD